MLWQQNRDLALALRDQGLADCLASRFALRPVNLKLLRQPVTFAHVTVSKSQQAVEKLTKGYLLWHSQSFDPTKGHAPFTDLLEDQPPPQRRALARLIQTLNLVNKSIVRELKWLESLSGSLSKLRDNRAAIMIISHPDSSWQGFAPVRKVLRAAPACQRRGIGPFPARTARRPAT